MSKKAFAGAGLILFLQSSASAQTPYLRGGVGWGMPFLTQTITGDGELYAGSTSSAYSPTNGNSTTYRLEKASFGAGGSASLAGGIFLNDHLGLELLVQIGFLGRNFSYTFSDTDPNGSSRTRTVDTRAAGSVVVCPSVVYRSAGKRAVPYGRIGPALPLHTARIIDITEQFTSAASFYNYTITAQAIEQSRFSLGLSAALGVSIPLWDRASLFAECSAAALQVYTRKRTYTSYFYNAENVIEDIPEEQRTTWYEMNLTDSGTSAAGTQTRPAYAIPFSALGLVAGVCIGW